MPGFFISNQSYKPMLDDSHSGFINECIDNNCFSIYRYTLPKFLNDKLFCEDESMIAIVEGIILNSSELYKDASLYDYVHNGIVDGNRFYENFRGNFSGAVYHKNDEYWEVFTDFLGMKPVFYYSERGKWFVASDPTEILKALNCLNLEYSLNTEASYDLLTYGFMIGDETLVNEVKKLPYGCYMKIAKGKIEISRYYEFEYCEETKKNIHSDDEYIENLDSLFKHAVKLQFDKDNEYGYDHLATLSGGLDSRMTVWVANTLGFNNIVNLTFGMSDCSDEKIAKMVANKLGNSMIIRTLNDGNMLSLYRDIVKLNGGISLYSGIAHSMTALSSINYKRYGILHTGDLGDAIVGSFAHKNEGDFPGAYSLKLKKYISHKMEDTKNIEKFKMVSRGFNGVGASKIVCENYIDCISPFLYKDFFEYCLSEIPFEKRDNHYIYKKWVMTKYHDSALIPLQRYNGGLMTEGLVKQTIRKIHRIGIKTVFEWCLWKIGIKHELSRKIVKSSMNPLDFWYENNTTISCNMDEYSLETIKKALNCPGLDKELLKNAEMLYREGNTSEKSQVLTLLSFIDDWFVCV